MMILILLIVISIDLSLAFFVIRKEKNKTKLAVLNTVEIVFIIFIWKLSNYYYVIKLGNSEWETPIFILAILYGLAHAFITGKHIKWLNKIPSS